MAKDYKVIIQDISTGSYRTETGWDSNIVNAKKFDQSYIDEIDLLPTGSYHPIFVTIIT